MKNELDQQTFLSAAPAIEWVHLDKIETFKEMFNEERLAIGCSLNGTHFPSVLLQKVYQELTDMEDAVYDFLKRLKSAREVKEMYPISFRICKLPLLNGKFILMVPFESTVPASDLRKIYPQVHLAFQEEGSLG